MPKQKVRMPKKGSWLNVMRVVFVSVANDRVINATIVKAMKTKSGRTKLHTKRQKSVWLRWGSWKDMLHELICCFSPSVTKMFRRWRWWTRRWSCQNRRRLWNSRWDGGLSRGVTGDTYGRWRSQYHPQPRERSPLGCLWGYRSRQRGRYRVGDVRPLQEQFCPCRWWSGREVRTRP